MTAALHYIRSLVDISNRSLVSENFLLQLVYMCMLRLDLQPSPFRSWLAQFTTAVKDNGLREPALKPAGWMASKSPGWTALKLAGSTQMR